MSKWYIMENAEDSKTVPAFQLQNRGLSDRCKDVFGSLDALEQKHQAFERSRAKDDADTDRHLIHQGPSDEDIETVSPAFKRPTFTGRDYHESRKGGRHGGRHGHERAEQQQQFRKPMPPQTQNRGRNSTRGRYGRSRSEPDYKLHPERWTEYSLEDVDTSDTANKRAALDFLHERRKMRDNELKEEVMDLETTACSKGLFTFKRPTKQTVDTTRLDAEKQKSFSNVEKMEDDNDTSDVAEEDLDSSTKDFKSESSLKRKLENIDIQDESDNVNVDEKITGFKSRKKIKRNFRAQRNNDADDADDTPE